MDMKCSIKKEGLNNGTYFFIVIIYMLLQITYHTKKIYYVLDKKILTIFKILPHLISSKTMKKINGVYKRAFIYAAEKCIMKNCESMYIKKLNFYSFCLNYIWL